MCSTGLWLWGILLVSTYHFCSCNKQNKQRRLIKQNNSNTTPTRQKTKSTGGQLCSHDPWSIFLWGGGGEGGNCIVSPSLKLREGGVYPLVPPGFVLMLWLMYTYLSDMIHRYYEIPWLTCAHICMHVPSFTSYGIFKMSVIISDFDKWNWYMIFGIRLRSCHICNLCDCRHFVFDKMAI